MKKYIRKFWPLLFAAMSIFFSSDACSSHSGNCQCDLTGYQWDVVGSKWKDGMGNPVVLNMRGMIIDGDGNFSEGTHKIQWVTKLDHCPDGYWGKPDDGYFKNVSEMRVYMKTTGLQPGEEPYLVASFDLDYAYYLGSVLRVEDDGKTVTLTLKEGCSVMLSKGYEIRDGQKWHDLN